MVRPKDTQEGVYFSGHAGEVDDDPQCVISRFRRGVNEICTLLEYHAALSGSSASTFRDNISVQL
jgi:hypothetical protein